MEQVAGAGHASVIDRAWGRDAVVRRHRVDWLLLYPLLIPAVLLAAGNDAFGFDPPGWLDSFTFLGYFWHYPEHLWVFDDNSNYKISRLPWVLPGYVAHTLFPPIVAAGILAYGALTSAAVAMYLHVRDATRDRSAAAVASVLLASCTGMHAPGGWYYHTLPAAGYYLWSCWLVTRAATAGGTSRAWAAAAGACFAAAVHTHLFLAVFSPLLVLLYAAALDTGGRPRWPAWRTTVIHAVAGAVGLTAVLAIVNRATGGAWLFFMPQVEIALRLSKGDPWWQPMQQWLPTATYLVLPLAMMAAGLSTGYRLWKPGERLTGTLVVLPCLALALTCVFQFWRQVTTLDYHYMAFVLFLHAIPAAATVACLRRSGSRAPGRQPVMLAIAAAVLLVPLLTLIPATLPAFMNGVVDRIGMTRLPTIVPPLLLAIAGVLVTRVMPGTVRVVVMTLWFSAVNVWVAPQPAAYGVGTAGVRQEMLETFREADEFTHRLDPSLIGIKYWLSSESLTTAEGTLPAQQVFDSFVATRAWLTNLFARTSPGAPIEQLTLADLDRASCIGILSSPDQQASLAAAMQAHYGSLARPLVVVAERRFERTDFGFALTLLRPEDAARESASSAPPCLTRDPRFDERGRERSIDDED